MPGLQVTTKTDPALPLAIGAKNAENPYHAPMVALPSGTHTPAMPQNANIPLTVVPEAGADFAAPIPRSTRSNYK